MKLYNNLRYADDSILLATPLEELQELVNRVERLWRSIMCSKNESYAERWWNTEGYARWRQIGAYRLFCVFGEQSHKWCACADEVKLKTAMGMAAMREVDEYVEKNKSVCTDN